MKRFRRWLILLFAMLLVMLFTTIAVLDVRGHWHGDVAWATIGDQVLGVNSSKGEVLLDGSLGCRVERGAHWYSYDLNTYDILHDPCRYVVAGFGADTYQVSSAGYPTVREFSVLLPSWFMLSLMSLLPAWYLHRRKKLAGRLSRPGHCLKCDYDLRATPDRCPECGTIPPKKEITAT
jgi:hypothetical protein